MGSDPRQIALSAFGLRDTAENPTEIVKIYYPQANKAIVTIEQNGIPDDSYSGFRYRVEFVLEDSLRV